MATYIYQYFSPQGIQTYKHLSNSSRLVLLEAEKHGVSWDIIPGTQIINLHYKGRTVSYYHQVPSTTTALAIFSAHNKETSANILRSARISVPKGYRVTPKDTAAYHKEIFEALKKPLVVKPSNGDLGDNITVNISTFAEYEQALELALSYDAKESTAIVEEMFLGSEYRILATQDKIIGILNRVPANVIGDGERTIDQLIHEKNAQVIRTEDGLHSHLQIKINADLKKNLGTQHLSLDSIPSEGTHVFLRTVSNISKGGEAIDCTDIAHKSVKEIAMRAMHAIPGLAFGGIDFMTTDITAKQTPDSYIIIEINDSPGFDIHDYPYSGINRHAAQEFLYLLLPELRKKQVLTKSLRKLFHSFLKN